MILGMIQVEINWDWAKSGPARSLNNSLSLCLAGGSGKSKY